MLLDLLDLVLPRDCAGCRAPGRTLCSACAHALTGDPFAHRPTPCPPGLPPLTAAATYDGVVRALLLAHKEDGRTGLAGPLGAALARAARLHGDGLLLVPVPSAPEAVRARGQDHARRLADRTARLLGTRSARLLAPTRAVADQSGLSAGDRTANLDGALRARRRLDGVAVLLVDDVVTTGATLAEAARALRAAGADVRGAAVVSATARWAPPRWATPWPPGRTGSSVALPAVLLPPPTTSRRRSTDERQESAPTARQRREAPGHRSEP